MSPTTAQDRRLADLEAAELHAARARAERFAHRAAYPSPPRGRRTVVPDDADDAPRFPAPPGMGGERWDARYRRHASVTSPSLERKDVPGPPMMAKVTARCYEVDLRGERDHTARPAVPATPRPRPPGEAHALRPKVTAVERRVDPVTAAPIAAPATVAPPPQIARDEPLRSNLEREPAPAPEPEPATPVPSSPSSSRAPEKPLYPTKKSTSSAPGVQFVWTEASSAKQKADAPSETDAPSSAPASAPSSRSSPSSSETPARSRSRSRSPSPSRSRDASNASRSSGSRSPSPRRRSRRSTSPGRSRDVSSSKGSDASFASRGWRGAANAFGSGMLRVSRGVSAARRVASDGASRAREGVGRAGDHLRRARDVVGSIPVRQVCLIARGALFENPGLRWNVRAPPAIEIRLGAPRGLGWFKVNEGRWRDARGPGDAPEVHREATPRRAPSRDHPASAFEVRSLGVVVARARDVDVSAAAEVIRAAAATPARLAREAGEYIANARDVQKRLFERAEEAVRRAEEVVGRKSEFIKGIPNTYYDEESPPPEPAGCFEDLDGYTHRAEDWSPYARDVEAADRLESMEAAERLGSKPASRTRRAPAPITPSLRSRAAAEAEAREAEAESARAKLASARAKPRRSSVDVRDVRLDEYEESLATRVRSLQRAFPDAADDIAEVVRRFDEDVVGATRAVEEIEAATVSVLMRGRAPTGEGFRAWLRELAEGRGVGRGAWREEHSAFHGERRDTLDDARVVTGDENRAATPTTRRFVTRLTGAFEDWSGRGANDALVDRDDIAEVVRRFDEDAAVADARARLSFGAWRKVAGTGPIAKASERAFVEVKEETEILRTPAPAPKSAPRALADLTNAEVTPATSVKPTPGPTSVKPTPGPTSVKPTPGPTPPRRFFNLIATPFARRRNRGGRDSDSPHSDWGSSESETSAGVSRAPESRGATSARSDWGSSESETSADASRAPESAGSTGSSAELWGSAGGALTTPSSGAASSKRRRDDASAFTSARRFVDRLEMSESDEGSGSTKRSPTNDASTSPVTAVTATESPFESAATSAWHSASRGARAVGRTPTVYFPESPEEEALEEELRRLERADAIAADFVAEENVVSPGPASMARVGHKLSGLHTATVYTLSPTSPLVGPRDGAPSRSPSTSSGSESGSTRRTSPPGDNAAAAAVRGGHVAAARAVFEREAAMRSYESHSSPVVPHRGSRVRR